MLSPHALRTGCSLASLLLCTLPLLAADDGGSTWQTSFAEARELSRKTGKPIFLVFRCER